MRAVGRHRVADDQAVFVRPRSTVDKRRTRDHEHHAAVGHRAGAVGIHLITALIGALDEPPGTYRLALRVRDVRLREAAGAVIGQDAESGHRRLADFRLCSS